MSLDIACKDTICAQSSAHGYGAIAMVRVSGPLSGEILLRIFRKTSGAIKPFVAMHGIISHANNAVIDDVVAIYFPDKKSFTGEESFEIHCHGNQLIVAEILQAICKQGARLAEPGEFSLRALLNGKIDLAQAESIADLIHAKSLTAKNVALSGLHGGLAEKTAHFRELIVEILAEIEARMDFPDEDLGAYDKGHIIQKLYATITQLKNMLSSANYGLRLHEGARIVIVGKPNAGKSTLLNILSGEERAIVHHEAGTTRDVLEASIDLFGIPVVFVDVAGIRAMGENAVEQIGITRALGELDKAHAIVWLADVTSQDPFCSSLIEGKLSSVNAPVLKVLNKCDANKEGKSSDSLQISAKHGLGINELKRNLHEMIAGQACVSDEIFITRARQKEELEQALNGFEQAYFALTNNLVDEVIASELRNAGYAFDRLFGKEIGEDILDKIFADFCIGK